MAPDGAHSYRAAGCFLLLLLVLLATDIKCKFLQPPQNITVFPNMAAEFTCQVSGGYTSWSVNGKPSNELSYDLRNSLDTSLYTTEDENPWHILTVMAKYEFNETTVQCLIDGGFSGRSDIVMLIVQGEQPEVVDFKAISNKTLQAWITAYWTLFLYQRWVHLGFELIQAIYLE